MNSGIYTKYTMKAFQQHIIYSQKVDAVKYNIIGQSMGYMKRLTKVFNLNIW